MKPKSGSALAKFASKAAKDYGAVLHRFLAHRMHSPQEVEDLAQEVYIRLLKIDIGEFVNNPRAYILQTASHVAHEYAEKDRRAQQYIVINSEIVEQVTENPGEHPTCQLAQRLSTQKQLNAALGKLSPIHRAVLLMHFREGYSREEIAKEIKVSVRQVKRYLAKAKEELMKIDWEWD